MNRSNQPTADSPADSRFPTTSKAWGPQIQDSEAEASQPAAEPKLLVTEATKVGEDMARRFKKIALASGMSEAQLFRLILVKAEALFAYWDERCNPRFFIDQFVLRDEQLMLFNLDPSGNLRCKR